MGELVAVLIGPPGAGKSTVGAQLAEALGVEFTDTDAMVEQRADLTVTEIFVQHGEARFRELEADAVADALHGGGVVALGGGAPMHQATGDLLDQLPVIFLDVAIADAAPRVGFDSSRPLLAVNPRATWTRLMNERRPTYARLARWQVPTGGRTPEEIVAQIVELVNNHED